MAALGVRRRPGRGVPGVRRCRSSGATSASTTRAGAPTSTRHRSWPSSASSTTSRAAAGGGARRTGARWSCSAPRTEANPSVPLPAVGGGVPRPSRGGTPSPPLIQSPCPPARIGRVPCWRPGPRGAVDPRRRRRWPRPRRPGRDGGALLPGLEREAASPATPSCSRSPPRGSWCVSPARPRRKAVRQRAAAARGAGHRAGPAPGAITWSSTASSTSAWPGRRRPGAPSRTPYSPPWSTSEHRPARAVWRRGPGRNAASAAVNVPELSVLAQGVTA